MAFDFHVAINLQVYLLTYYFLTYLFTYLNNSVTQPLSNISYSSLFLSLKRLGWPDNLYRHGALYTNVGRC